MAAKGKCLFFDAVRWEQKHFLIQTKSKRWEEKMLQRQDCLLISTGNKLLHAVLAWKAQEIKQWVELEQLVAVETAATKNESRILQQGKQDYKKNKPVLRAARLKAEAKKTGPGIKEVALVLVAILICLLAFYSFFFLNLGIEPDPDLNLNEN
ncbi:triple QxxK/R motif-containing protein [Microcaecilia unicolor]|uniref:Triple QxxK/R motif-containing protein n=1 Tax=Microcaecilia unicolor TaxID=1415580 RepID=A0A6P7X4W5_9AMPH|nr:triple QxxK/R motif-containing protein [Microcaecilia unicolor]